MRAGAARGLSRVGILAALGTLCAILLVANVLVGGRSGDREDTVAHAGPTGTTEPLRDVGVGGLDAAPGAKTAEQRAAEEAARDAAAAMSAIPRSQAIYGLVLDGKGKPVAGADVKLLPVPKEDLYKWGAVEREPVATAKSGTDGSYVVGPAPEGSLKVRAEAAGYAPTTQQVNRRGARIDLILDRGGSLRILVQNVEGKPVEGAKVAHTAGSSVLNGVTDAEGRIAFEAVPTGTGSLLVYKDGYGAARRQDVALVPDEKRDVSIILMAPIVLKGRVLTVETERPIPGSTVKVSYPSMPGVTDPVALTTDEDGQFKAELVAGQNEQVEVLAEAPEYSPSKTWLQVTDAGGHSMETVVKLGKGGPPITGRVVDERGKAAGGVTVTIAWQAPGKGTPETKSDDDGRFELPMPPGAQPGAWWQLFAISDTGAMGSGNAKMPAAGERVPPVTITLTGCGRVRGVVRDATGKPLEGALVALSVDWSLMRQQRGRAQPNWMVMNLLQDTRRFSLDAVTTQDGIYEIPNVPCSMFRLTATHGLDVATPADPVNVEAGGIAMVDVTLGEGQTIEGRVEEEDGKPVAGAWVNANLRQMDGGWGGRWLNARSQSDGSFVLRGVTDGTWNLSAYASGFGGKESPSVTAGTKDVVLRLTAMGAITGVVYDNGRPYRGTFSVAAQWQQTDPKGGPQQMFPGNQNSSSFNTDDGKYELRNLAAGRYVVTATTPEGMITVQGRTVDVVNGRTTPDVGLILTAGATLTGTVSEESGGKPVANASVSLSPKPGPNAPTSNASVQTDSNGKFAARGLAPGLYWLYVNPPSGIYWTEEIEIRAGAEQSVRLVERVPGKIRVFVVDAEGRPLANAQPTVMGASGNQVWPSWQAMQKEGLTEQFGNNWDRMIKTDSSGVNLRHHVPPGRYQVSAQLQGFDPPAELPWVDVASGRTTEVTVTMRPKEGGAGGPSPVNDR